MSNELESLEKILDENPGNTILDSNVLIINSGGFRILEYLFECRKISDIDSSLLQIVRDDLIGMNMIIDKFSNIYAINEIIEEKRAFHEKFNEMHKWHKKRAKNRECEELRLMEEISGEIFELIRSIKRNEARIQSPLYESILKCIGIFSEKYDGIVGQKTRLYNGHERKNEKQDSGLKTDEKIIATTFYRALKEEKPLNIISNDEHMTNKFELSYKLLSCRELYYSLSRLKDSKIRFFSISPKQRIYVPRHYTPEIPIQDKFSFLELNAEENKELKYDIDEILYYGQKENDPHKRD